jgi:hypothetical protein
MSKLIGTGPNQVPTNADLGTMAYQDNSVTNDGSTAGLAIRSNRDVGNIITSGAYWFNLGNGTFQTYVDVDYDGRGKFALVAKQGGSDMDTQTFQAGQYDIFDINAHGEMTNTTVTVTSKDQVSRDNCNALFRLNGSAFIMSVDIKVMAHCNSYGHFHKYYVKKVTNQNTFDAWAGMFHNSSWGDATTCAYSAPLPGVAYKITGAHTTQVWSNNNTDFTMTENDTDLKDWDCNTEVSYGMPNNQLIASRHAPIVTDWNGGCQWLRGLRSNGYIATDWGSSGLIWVKI